ncbi:MAG TPA: hypothetical protein VFQ83_00790 [Candidatus Udaeobacter sp.]|nr:hypothetical protein [Candidatus Udaeobacter sp.]
MLRGVVISTPGEVEVTRRCGRQCLTEWRPEALPGPARGIPPLAPRRHEHAVRELQIVKQERRSKTERDEFTREMLHVPTFNEPIVLKQPERGILA